MPEVRTAQTAQSVTIPSPVGGLNGRDSLAAMSPIDAVTMDNLVPGTSRCETRNGSVVVQNIGTAIESLFSYKGGATQKLLCGTGGKIYDAIVGGAALQSGRTGNDIVATMFSNAGSQFLIGVSGADVPFSYNGVAIANLVMTGVTGAGPTSLNSVFTFKGRLYWLQTGMPGFYYLAVGAVQGAMSYFDLAQVAARGGSVTNIGSYSLDGESGATPQDFIVFATSEGEYIVYAGFDPSAAANWTLVGRYYAAPPIGRRAMLNYGSDLYIITSSGLLPMSAIRAPGRQEASDKALTVKLGDVLRASAVAYPSALGWCAVEYPRAGWLVLNVPSGATVNDARIQYVMNTTTNAWCRFTGWNALCFAVHAGKLYYGLNNGNVVEANNGVDDNGPDGTPITVQVRQSWNNFDDDHGLGSANKQFHFATLLIGTINAPILSASMSVDFGEIAPAYIGVLQGDANTKKYTLPFSSYGEYGSLALTIVLTGSSFKWYSTKFLVTRASGLF